MTDPNIAIVLMDIMMPGMDGYQAMEVIRSKPEHRTAADHRADGKGDEGRPREMPGGGASDYLAKPVNTEQLLSALRAWLHR
jgi:CheY-like chemotaxis protein